MCLGVRLIEVLDAAGPRLTRGHICCEVASVVRLQRVSESGFRVFIHARC